MRTTKRVLSLLHAQLEAIHAANVEEVRSFAGGGASGNLKRTVSRCTLCRCLQPQGNLETAG
jgi:hypothetical protein